MEPLQRMRVFRLWPLALALRPDRLWTCVFWALPWTPGYVLAEQMGLDPADPLVGSGQHQEHEHLADVAPHFSVPISPDGSLFLYAGLPGEPALGPQNYSEPLPANRLPDGPLTQHWLDAQDLAYGVLTLEGRRGPWKMEASSFNAKDPGGPGTRNLNSWSTRLSLHADPGLAMQVSYGQWSSPEMLEQSAQMRRLTASASYHVQRGAHRWKTTVAWGLNNRKSPEQSSSLPGWMLESKYVLNRRHTFFGRVEEVKQEGLFDLGSPLYGHAMPVGKISVGYVFDSIKAGALNLGVGALKGIYSIPTELDSRYGSHPRSYLVFLQGRI
ncbi:MAG: hypothetical protein ACM3VZ_02650 [Acidobacteriota bacterium]